MLSQFFVLRARQSFDQLDECKALRGGGGQAEVLPKSAEMGFPPFLYTAHCTRTMLSNIGWARIIRMVGGNIWETWSQGSGTIKRHFHDWGKVKGI